MISTLTYKAVRLKQPPSLAKHLKLKSMHFNTRSSDQLLLQHPPVGTNSYGRHAFSYTAPTVWSKVADYVRNAPSVMSFRKHLKTLFWILAFINVSVYVSHFWVRLHEIGYMK